MGICFEGQGEKTLSGSKELATNPSKSGVAIAVESC